MFSIILFQIFYFTTIQIKFMLYPGPLKFGMFSLLVSPLLDLTQLTNFYDESFYVKWHADLVTLVNDVERSLEMITHYVFVLITLFLFS